MYTKEDYTKENIPKKYACSMQSMGKIRVGTPSITQEGSSLSGAPGVIRTPDLLVRSQTLYPTELRARIFNDLCRTPEPQKRFRQHFSLLHERSSDMLVAIADWKATSTFTLRYGKAAQPYRP
jgi:hypothetical protein